MNHCVPEFEMDEDYPISSSADMPRQKNMQQDEIMELLWQNGQVVVQSQNPRLLRKHSPPMAKSTHYHQQQQEEYHQPPSRLAPPPPPPNSDSTAQLFMQEDEMISWLQYPLEDPGFDRDLTDLLYQPPGPPPSTSAATAPLRPPPPPPFATQQQNPAQAPAMGANFPHFTRTTTKIPDSGPSASSRYDEPRESTVVDSSDTPAVRQKSKIPPTGGPVEVSGGRNRICDSVSGGGAIAGTSTAGGSGWCKSMSRDGETCELTLTSSPSGASASATATADLTNQPPADCRKRKGRDPADDATTEYQSEDAEIESYDIKKQARGAAGKRSRAAEVHNLSERRRRDRINEKMKALQELIPRCTKTDKASMLDEAIEYLKSLQLQVQMMSMGCGMVPVMFPGLQQYMPSMGMGMGMSMGIGMGMEMGMTRPMMPFPGVLPGSGLPTPGAPSHMSPRFPLQAFPMPPIPGHDPSRMQQACNQTVDVSANPSNNMPRRPNMTNPQSHPTSQPSANKPSSSKGADNDENR